MRLVKCESDCRTMMLLVQVLAIVRDLYGYEIQVSVSIAAACTGINTDFTEKTFQCKFDYKM